MNRARMLIVIVLLMSLASAGLFPGGTAQGMDSDGDGISNDVEGEIGTDPQDPMSPGIYCIYQEEFMTRDYGSWVAHSSGNIATEALVIRRGTAFQLEGPQGSNLELGSVEDGWSGIDISQGPPWHITVSDDADIGNYFLNVSSGSWQGSMKMHVIFNPFILDMKVENLAAYCYDEDSDNDSRDAIYPRLTDPRESDLHPFDFDEEYPATVEMALAAAGHDNKDYDAMLGIFRMVSQRNRADLTCSTNFLYYDVQDVLFFSNETIEALTLEDARRLRQNNVSIDDLASPGKQKFLNGWCMETALSTVALARSIGIPARTVTLGSLEGLMGHYIAELWLERTPVEQATITKSPEYNENWYIFDPDEWHYPVSFWAPEYPAIYGPTGDTIIPRGMYNKTIHYNSNDLYHYNLYVCVNSSWNLNRPFLLNRFYDLDNTFYLQDGTVRDIPMSLGGGLYFVMEIENSATVNVSVEGGISVVLLTSNDDYPSSELPLHGQPFPLGDEYRGNDIEIEEPGTYYLSIYPYTEPSAEVRGNYGHVTIEVQKEPLGFFTKYRVPLAIVGLMVIILLSWIHHKRFVEPREKKEEQ